MPPPRQTAIPAARPAIPPRPDEPPERLHIPNTYQQAAQLRPAGRHTVPDRRARRTRHRPAAQL
jgi:hypothetical protein